MSSPSTDRSDAAGGDAQQGDPRVGTILSDRYRLDALLGEGGMGKVYAAEHVLMRKRLAVKILHRELTAVPEVVARFEREAMAAANIDHPNVAAATDFGKLGDGSVFLVLEFVQGRNLRDEIAQGPMPFERALRIARQIASGLAAAHALDIVHRDLKPENVMLIQKGADPDFVKILDFGIAKVPIAEKSAQDKGGKPITKVGMVFGTPEYMAPEQALGQPVDGRADVYALGVILYEMMAGVRPFSSKSSVGILGQQLSKPPPAISERVPGLFVPPAIEQLVQRLLCREASERTQTASDIVSSLEALLGPSEQRGRLFTMAAGSPPSAPSSPRIESIPDLIAPLVPPDAFFAMPSSPDSIGQSQGPVPAALSRPDPLEAELDDAYEPSQPSISQPSISRPSISQPSISQPSIAGLPREADRFKESLRDLVLRGRRALRSTCDFIDDRRERLPPALREPLAKVPAPALLLAAVVLVAGSVLGLIMIVGVAMGSRDRGPRPSPSASVGAVETAPGTTEAPPAAVARASEADIEAAKSKGVEALGELETKYPKDAAVLLARMKAELSAKKHADAVATVSRLLALDPKLNENPAIASALWTTAQAKDSSDGAYTLLEGAMGARGADLIYDLATTKGVRPDVKARADKWLDSAALEKQASPALQTVVALKKAVSCSQRKSLLPRAKDEGDERALALLEQYQTSHGGCGKRGKEDCHACMRDGGLADAIETLRKRARK